MYYEVREMRHDSDHDGPLLFSIHQCSVYKAVRWAQAWLVRHAIKNRRPMKVFIRGDSDPDSEYFLLAHLEYRPKVKDEDVKSYLNPEIFW